MKYILPLEVHIVALFIILVICNFSLLITAGRWSKENWYAPTVIAILTLSVLEFIYWGIVLILFNK